MKVDSSYTADFVREELRSRYRLVDETTASINGASTEEEADLVDERSSNDNSISNKGTGKVPSDSALPEPSSSSRSLAPQWRLHDVLDEPDKEASVATLAKAVPSNDPTSETGLRHRKGTTNSSSNTALDGSGSKPEEAWTIVQERDLMEDDEETLLVKKDPVELLGGWFPPRDLKVAQQKARMALEGYIQGANEAAAILALLNEHQQVSPLHDGSS